MEQKRFDKKNLIVIVIVILMIAVVAVVAAVQKRELNPTLGDLAADATAVPDATDAASPEATRVPADAYLVVSVAGEMYEPIPLYEEARYTITRGDMVNVIAVTTDSVWMHESTCENQDCVLQGVVSLSNRSERVLQNMILCLPNEVVLELYTREELADMLLYMAGYTGEEANE